jgi:hypothetical protein
MFLLAGEYERYEDLKFTLARTVAYFRAAVGGDLDDPYVKDLVEQLSLKSSDFRRLWAKHDVLSAVSGSNLHLHPAVGVMRLSFQTFAVGGTDGQTLFATTARPQAAGMRRRSPGSPTWRAVSRSGGVGPRLPSLAECLRSSSSSPRDCGPPRTARRSSMPVGTSTPGCGSARASRPTRSSAQVATGPTGSSGAAWRRRPRATRTSRRRRWPRASPPSSSTTRPPWDRWSISSPSTELRRRDGLSRLTETAPVTSAT